MKTAFAGLYFGASLVLLMLTFRIDEYLQNFTFTKSSTVASYVILAFVLTLLAYFVAPWLTRLLLPKSEASNTARALATAGIAFLVLCVMSVLLGPLGVDIPGTRVNGIFFSEWKFINFILYDGIILALLAGLLTKLREWT